MTDAPPPTPVTLPPLAATMNATLLGSWLTGSVWGLQLTDTQVLFAACHTGGLGSTLLALFTLLPLYVFVGVTWLFLSHKELLLWVAYTLSFGVTALVANAVADTLRVQRPAASAPCTASFAVPDAWFVATMLYLALNVVYPYVYAAARHQRRPATHAVIAVVAGLYAASLGVNGYLTWVQLGINFAIVAVAAALWFTYLHTLVVPYMAALMRLPAVRWLSFESDLAHATTALPNSTVVVPTRGLESSAATASGAAVAKSAPLPSSFWTTREHFRWWAQ